MPTIKDVAEKCGVRQSTVSYVLNNSRPVAEHTRKSILAAIDELGYHPSAVARGLSLKRMNTIGLIMAQNNIVPSSNPYFGPVLDGIVAVAESKGMNTMLFTGQFWSNEASDTRTYTDGRCDGLILVSPHVDSNIVPSLRKTRVPFVVIGENIDTPEVCAVDVDHRSAAYKVVEYLVGLGHTRIAILGGETVSRSARERLDGYRLALETHSIDYNEALVPGADWAPDSVPDRVQRLLRLPANQTPTAIFGANDELALEALRYLTQLGVRVPQDISVVGFDDNRDAAKSIPALTTMRQPMMDLGVRGAELLIRCINNHSEMGEKIILPTELIIRGTTAPPGQTASL